MIQERIRSELHIYDKVLADISKARPLPGEGARIFLYLLGRISRDNTIPSPSEIALDLGLLRPNVSRAYQTMLSDGYLVKADDHYYIHPMIAYYGTEAKREWAVSKALVASVKMLAQAEQIARGHRV